MYKTYATKNEYIEYMLEKYADMVYRLAISRTRDKDNGEDVFQEVFLRLSKNLPDFESEEHEKAWLIRVTIKCRKNLLNSKWNRCVDSLETELTEEDIKMDSIYYDVLRLPQKYRTVIHLFYYENLPIKEISRILNTKETTIKTWLMRGRKKLKEMLEGGEKDDK